MVLKRDTCPKIRRASIEIQLQGLGWRADGHFAEVLRVVLLVFCRHFAGLTVGGSFLLQDFLLYMGFATYARSMLALMVDLVAYEVGSLFGGADLVLPEEVDVGFGPRTLVLGVMDELNLGEIASHGCRLRSLGSWVVAEVEEGMY